MLTCQGWLASPKHQGQVRHSSMARVQCAHYDISGFLYDIPPGEGWWQTQLTLQLLQQLLQAWELGGTGGAWTRAPWHLILLALGWWGYFLGPVWIWRGSDGESRGTRFQGATTKQSSHIQGFHFMVKETPVVSTQPALGDDHEPGGSRGSRIPEGPRWISIGPKKILRDQ